MSYMLIALRHGGETLTSVRGCERGVAVGISNVEYSGLLTRTGAPLTAYTALQGSLSVACGRLSYTFGFSGPSYSIDTACSSSLASTHLACKTIESTESYSSVSLGVQTFLIPGPFVVLVISNMLAADGRCKTLDQTADGYVRSEACGVLELKPVADDAGRALVLVCGSAVNQDGRSSSLTAPNGPSQQAVIRSSVERSELEMTQYEQHEMHGTGTALGDPIEVGAACAMLLGYKAILRPIKLSAAKIAHGHAEAGAGMVGSMQALTSLAHAHGSMLTNLRTVNPYVAETIGVARMTAAPREQYGQGSMQGHSAGASGISSFAFQGTNAHALLGGGGGAQAPLVEIEFTWDKQSLWLAPRAHPLTSKFCCHKPSLAITQSMMNSASLSYLWDCHVNDRSLLPGTALLELSTAGACNLFANEFPASMYALQDMSFGSQVQLSARGSMLPGNPPKYLLQLISSLQGSSFEITLPDSSTVCMNGRLVLLQVKHAFSIGFSPCDIILNSEPFCRLSHSFDSSAVFILRRGARMQSRTNKAQTGDYRLHPVVLENCLQLLLPIHHQVSPHIRTVLPATVRSFVLNGCLSSLHDFAVAEIPEMSRLQLPVSNVSLQGQVCKSSMAVLLGWEVKDINDSQANKSLVFEHGGYDCEPTNLCMSSPSSISGRTLKEKTAALRTHVMDQVSRVLGGPVGLEEPILSAGLDSLGLAELRVQLAQPVGMMILPASVIFDYPSVQQLTGFLEEQLDDEPSPDADIGAGFSQAMQDASPQRVAFTGTPDDHKAALISSVMDIVTQVLGFPVVLDERLMDAGLGLLEAAELRVQLANVVGMSILPASIMFDYLSIQALADYLETQLPAEAEFANPRMQASFQDMLHGILPAPFSGTPEQQRIALFSHVMDVVGGVIGTSVSADENLLEAGLDSTGVSELRVQLARAVGMMMLPASVVFDYPSIQALVGFLEPHLENQVNPLTLELADPPIIPCVQGGDRKQLDSSPVLCLEPFENTRNVRAELKDSIQKAVAKELRLDHWSVSYDEIQFGKLGLSYSMINAVKTSLFLDVQVTDEDTVNSVVDRILG